MFTESSHVQGKANRLDERIPAEIARLTQKDPAVLDFARGQTD